MRANGVQSKSNGPSYQMPNPLMGDVVVILVLVVILVVILMLSFALMLIMR